MANQGPPQGPPRGPPGPGQSYFREDPLNPVPTQAHRTGAFVIVAPNWMARLQPDVPPHLRRGIEFPAQYSYAHFPPEDPDQTDPPVQWWLYSPRTGQWTALDIRARIVRRVPCRQCQQDGPTEALHCDLAVHPCGRCQILQRRCTFVNVNITPGEYHWGPDILVQLGIQPSLPPTVGPQFHQQLAAIPYVQAPSAAVGGLSTTTQAIAGPSSGNTGQVNTPGAQAPTTQGATAANRRRKSKSQAAAGPSARRGTYESIPMVPGEPGESPYKKGCLVESPRLNTAMGNVRPSLSELLTFLPRSLRRHRFAREALNSGWGQASLSHFMNRARDYHGDSQKREPNTTLKALEWAMRTQLDLDRGNARNDKWAPRLHAQFRNDADTRAQDTTRYPELPPRYLPEPDVALKDLAKGVVKWPDVPDRTGLTFAVEYAKNHPTMTLRFPQDVNRAASARYTELNAGTPPPPRSAAALRAAFEAWWKSAEGKKWRADHKDDLPTIQGLQTTTGAAHQPAVTTTAPPATAPPAIAPPATVPSAAPVSASAAAATDDRDNSPVAEGDDGDDRDGEGDEVDLEEWARDQ